MFKHATTRSLLLGTALTLPWGGAAFGQTIEINEEELAGKSQECRTLAQEVQNMETPVTAVPAEDVVTAINDDVPEECARLQQQVASSGSERETTSQSEEVDLSEEATVEGEAVVTVPDPNVDVQVPAPNVRVTEQQPQVDISREPTEIEVVQQQPTIAIEIPEIMVRVEVPAPNIYILRADPQVQVSSADPQVEVEQGEPTVDVTQADPELALDLGVDPGAEGSGQAGVDSSSETSGGSVQNVESNVDAAGGEPQVEVVQAEGEPQVSYESSEPTVSYRGAEPQVSILMAEKPTIEVQQTGEATVTVETPEEREQRRRQQQNASDQGTSTEGQAEAPLQSTLLSEQPGTEAAPASEQASTAPQGDQPEQPSTGGGSMMTVGELMDMSVVTADGEDLGSPEGFVEVNGETNLVLSSGGFLGIGEKQVPVPTSRVTVQEDQLVVNALTEDELEAANDFEYDSNLHLPEDRQVEVGGG